VANQPFLRSLMTLKCFLISLQILYNIYQVVGGKGTDCIHGQPLGFDPKNDDEDLPLEADGTKEGSYEGSIVSY
jgi:hypothetical protein